MRPQLNSDLVGRTSKQPSSGSIVRAPIERYSYPLAGGPGSPPDLDDLSPEDKVRYVGSLCDRIVPDQSQVPISEAQRAPVRERLAAPLANYAAARPWSEVHREIELTVSKRSSR